MADHSVILLVDDSEDDIFLIQKAFARASVPNPIHALHDGVEAVAYLNGEGRYRNRWEYPLPVLILLDLKTPRVDGFQFLEWIRAQSDFVALPVVVLTSSDRVREINTAYSFGADSFLANSFLVKPGDFENYEEMAEVVAQYWTSTVSTPECELPPRKQHTTERPSR